jgi:hypothetical protein
MHHPTTFWQHYKQCWLYNNIYANLLNLPLSPISLSYFYLNPITYGGF